MAPPLPSCSSSSGSPRLFSEVHTDRAIRLLTLGLLCLVAAMVWSIRARQVGAGGNLALSTPPFGVTPPPALLVKAVQAAADAEFCRVGSAASAQSLACLCLLRTCHCRYGTKCTTCCA